MERTASATGVVEVEDILMVVRKGKGRRDGIEE